jgi:hypothetical protein
MGAIVGHGYGSGTGMDTFTLCPDFWTRQQAVVRLPDPTVQYLAGPRREGLSFRPRVSVHKLAFLVRLRHLRRRRRRLHLLLRLLLRPPLALPSRRLQLRSHLSSHGGIELLSILTGSVTCFCFGAPCEVLKVACGEATSSWRAPFSSRKLAGSDASELAWCDPFRYVAVKILESLS